MLEAGKYGDCVAETVGMTGERLTSLFVLFVTGTAGCSAYWDVARGGKWDGMDEAIGAWNRSAGFTY